MSTDKRINRLKIKHDENKCNKSFCVYCKESTKVDPKSEKKKRKEAPSQGSTKEPLQKKRKVENKMPIIIESDSDTDYSTDSDSDSDTEEIEEKKKKDVEEGADEEADEEGDDEEGDDGVAEEGVDISKKHSTSDASEGEEGKTTAILSANTEVENIPKVINKEAEVQRTESSRRGDVTMSESRIVVLEGKTVRETQLLLNVVVENFENSAKSHLSKIKKTFQNTNQQYEDFINELTTRANQLAVEKETVSYTRLITLNIFF